MQNPVISDLISYLSFVLYRGNAFSRVFTLPQPVTAPATVSGALYHSAGGRLCADDAQPVVTVLGQQITIAYPNTNAAPATAWQEIKFDGRAVWQGPVRCEKASGPMLPASGVVLLQIAPAVTVDVAYSSDAVDAAASAAQAAASAALALSLLGNVVTLISSDEQSVTLGLGGNILAVVNDADQFPYVELTLL